MGEILAGAGVVSMLAVVALMSIVLKFAYVVVPVLLAWAAVAWLPSSSFRTPVPIRVRSRR